MIRTFLDSGVLFTAIRSTDPDKERALCVIASSERLLITSPFIHLEIMPKAQYHGNSMEKNFYDAYFRGAEWYEDVDQMLSVVRREAAKCGLSALDALHVAAAFLAGADELITTGKPTKPMFRTKLVNVTYLFH